MTQSVYIIVWTWNLQLSRCIVSRRGLLEQGPRRREKVGPIFSGSRVLILRAHKHGGNDNNNNNNHDDDDRYEWADETGFTYTLSCAHREIHFWIYDANLWVRYTVIHTALLTTTTTTTILLDRYYFRACVKYNIIRSYNEIKIYETVHIILYKLGIII